MVNFNEFMRKFSEEVDGQYSEYDNSRSVIIVPLEDKRYQAVVGEVKFSQRFGKEGIELNSKVCEFSDQIDLKKLMETNQKLCYSKFVLDDGFIKVEASAFFDVVTEELLREIITEVANVADEWEFKLTGLDVH